jgi:single-stranded DNA-binding protein
VYAVINEVRLLGRVSQRGVTLRQTRSGTPCAAFFLSVEDEGAHGRRYTALHQVECGGQHAKAASTLQPGMTVLVEGRLVRRQTDGQWETVVVGRVAASH